MWSRSSIMFRMSAVSAILAVGLVTSPEVGLCAQAGGKRAPTVVSAKDRAAIVTATIAYVAKHGAVPASKIKVTVGAVSGAYARVLVAATDGSTDDAAVFLKKGPKGWSRIAGPGTDWDPRELDRLGVPKAVRGE